MNDEQMKRCSRCGIEKPARDFHRHIRMSDGLASMCKVPCRREVGREYRATNAESIRAKKSSPEALARQRELAKTEIGRAKERNRKRTGPGKRRQRDWTYRTKYGITLLEYEAMFKKQ